MSALDKVLAHHAQQTAPPLVLSQSEHPAALTSGDTLVAAAMSAAAELLIALAWDPDHDGDDDSTAKGDTDHDHWTADGKKKSGKGADDGKGDGGEHSSHAAYKKFVKNGMKPAAAAKACARSDKNAKATALAEGVLVALGGLQADPDNWVELTASDPVAVALAGKGAEGDGSKPYGNVTYADPGYQSDGKKRYPIDTEEHVRAALSYIGKAKNAGRYSAQQLASIKAKIRSAAKKFGIGASDGEGSTASATMTEDQIIALARGSKPAGPLAAMHHPPFTGAHSHGHHTRVVHDHEHFHNNDSDHDFHAHGSGDGDGGDRTPGDVRAGW